MAEPGEEPSNAAAATGGGKKDAKKRDKQQQRKKTQRLNKQLRRYARVRTSIKLRSTRGVSCRQQQQGSKPSSAVQSDEENKVMVR
jgi:hypothetical protein